MPRLLRLYLISIAIGFVLSFVFTTLLLVLDVAGLWHLVTSTRGGVIAVIMLLWFHTLLFSGVQFGYAVMRLAEKSGGGGGKTSRTAPLVPAYQPQPALIPHKPDRSDLYPAP